MKKITKLAVCLTLLVVATTGAASACNQQCGITTLPDGTDQALCLTYPEDDLFNICIEVNLGMIHECIVDQICWNGFPIA